MPRRLGQHFLRPASVERLLEVLAPQPEDVFLEIGPGAGALTIPLALHQDRQAWQRLMRNGMAQDFSWERSARLYEELYRRALARL